MKRKVTIEYEWSNGGQAITIPRHHLLPLQDRAEEFIQTMRSKGYISGEMSTEVQDKDAAEPASYRGWWSAIIEACNV